VLASFGARTTAFIADPDAHGIALVDVEDAMVLGAVRTSGTPEQLLSLPDGRIVATLSDQSKLDVLEPSEDGRSLARLCSIDVPAGPFGLALSADGETLAVTSDADAMVTFLDAATLGVRGGAEVARSPRGVLFRGDKAFVSHMAGARLSVIDASAPRAPATEVDLSLRAGTPLGPIDKLTERRTGSQGYALVSVTTAPDPAREGRQDAVRDAAPAEAKRRASRERIVVPMVSVDPGSPGSATQFYYGPPPFVGVPKQAPTLVLVDPEKQASLSTHVLAATPDVRSEECFLPRAAAYRASTERLYVACRGNDQLLELDARAADPMRAVVRRWKVGIGPSGVAIDDSRGVAVVAGAFEGKVSLVALDRGTDREVVLTSSADDRVAAGVLGRSLFYRTNDARLTADGIACASCHPEGREDGLTWSTPEGPRQTLMLAGRVEGTGPYGWTRNQPTLTGYIADTSKRLGGSASSEKDFEAIASYLRSLPSPPRARTEAELALYGKGIFSSRGCISCHGGDMGTDNTTHALERAGEPVIHIDTPGLRSVRLSAPYFHDGRYKSLRELLSDPTSAMGQTKNLTPSEVDALEAYLRTL
jgi:hypothetical protein